MPEETSSTMSEGERGVFLACIYRRRKLRVAEHIHHTVVADAVAAAKFPVGVVIGHAPAKAAGHALLRNGIVDPGGIAQSLHQPVGLVVKGLGGQLLPAELADEVACGDRKSPRRGLRRRHRATVRVIVVGVNILQQLALAVVPRAAVGRVGSSRWMASLVRL